MRVIEKHCMTFRVHDIPRSEAVSDAEGETGTPSGTPVKG
jgi:hypothetical protein